MAFLAALFPAFAGVTTTAAAVTTAASVGAVTGLAAAGVSAFAAKRARDIQRGTQIPSIKSLAPPPLTGPTVSETETQKVKESADKRAADIQAGIKADTLAAQGRRSLTGLAATIRTSARGLVGTTATEKKTLLGQGGLR